MESFTLLCKFKVYYGVMLSNRIGLKIARVCIIGSVAQVRHGLDMRKNKHAK